MKQYLLTPAAGKRLIAKAVVKHPAVQHAQANGRIVIVTGTTNGYVAEELLAAQGRGEGFSRQAFFRGVSAPATVPTDEAGRLTTGPAFPGDLIIDHGEVITGKTIFDVVEELREGDLVIKGANCLDLAHRRAGVLIGHPKGGTIMAVLQAAAGRRVGVLIPVGLEKRIPGDLDALAVRLNAPGGSGFRLLPYPGEVFTELDAVTLVSGAAATLFAAGGICGAEGAVWLAVEGTSAQEEQADKLLRSCLGEPPFSL